MNDGNSPLGTKPAPVNSLSIEKGDDTTLGNSEWVMCVGEDKSFVDRIKAVLDPLPEINCRFEPNFKLASTHLATGDVDLILVDCKSHHDIEDVFQTLNAKELDRIIPICFLLEESLFRCFNEKSSYLGTFDFLPKPYNDKNLTLRVSLLLARARSLRKLELGLGHISALVVTRDRVRSVAITLSYVLQALRPPGVGYDVSCWFFKGDTQWLKSSVQFRLVKPNTEPHTKRQLVTNNHAMIRFKQIKSQETPYADISLEGVELKEGSLWLPVKREGYLRAVVCVSSVGIEPPSNEIEIRLLNAFLGILSLSLEGIDIYAEVISLEKKMGRTRLEELGNMAIKLGDRLNTPLNILTLAIEELEDACDEIEEAEKLIPIARKGVDTMRMELKALSKFKEFADKEALERDIFSMHKNSQK